MSSWMRSDDPTYWDQCDECEHYRSEHAAPPDPVCGCDVLGIGEWYVCPCPEFLEPVEPSAASRSALSTKGDS